MKKNSPHPGNNHSLFRAALLGAAALLFASAGLLPAQTFTWTGGGSPDFNWTNTANWSGGAAPTVGGVTTLIFTGTVGMTNTNNISGLTGISTIEFGTANGGNGWNIYGNQITLGSANSYIANTSSANTGSNTWNIPLVLPGSCLIELSNNASVLNFTGVLSGAGNMFTWASTQGEGQIYLSNPSNSFTGANATTGGGGIGPGAVTFNGGHIWFNCISPSGQMSSFGAGYNPLYFGGYYSTTPVDVAYIGTNNSSTDLPWTWEDGNYSGSTVTQSFSNNSPSNAGLTFLPNSTWSVLIGDGQGNGATYYPWTLTLGGTSTGTNVFLGSFLNDSPNYSVNVLSIIPVGLTINGPGTWVFGGPFNTFSNTETIANSAHVVIISNQEVIAPVITMASGCTLDVSWNDTNNYPVPYAIGANGAQTLTAGHTGSTTGTDIIGSLALGSGAMLYVSGNGVAGTLSITNNPTVSTPATFQPGSGAISFDLGATTNVGTGVSDLIHVYGNLDLSQGIAQITTKELSSSIATNVPYTLIEYTGNLIPWTGAGPGLTVAKPNVSYSNGIVSTNTLGKVTVTFTSSGLSPSTLLWTGGNGNWDVDTTQNWVYNNKQTVSAFFDNLDSVIFNDTANNFSVDITGDAAPGTILVSNSLHNYTMFTTSGGFIGSGSLTKQGTGVLTLTTPNTFSANTVLSAGTLVAVNSGALGSLPVTMGDSNTGANPVALLLAGGATLTNPVTITTHCAGSVTLGRLGGLPSTVSFASVTLNTNVIFNSGNASGSQELLVGSLAGAGNVTVTGGGLTEWSAAATFTGNIDIQGNPTNAQPLTELQLDQNPANSPNLTVETNSALLLSLNNITVGALNGGGFVSLQPSVDSPLTLTLGAGNASGLFSGVMSNLDGSLNPISLIKTGSGTQVLTGNNSATPGTVTVSAGVLEVDSASGLPTGSVTVAQGATLDGIGSIQTSSTNNVTLNGALTVGDFGDTSGATFTLQNSGSGGLIVNTNASLNVNLYSGAGLGDNSGNSNAADVFDAQCPVTLNNGCVLNVGNPNAMTAWAAGDQWEIANWQSLPANSFTTLNLPSLPSSLAWTVTNLYSNGIIAIVSSAGAPTEPANILGVTMSGTNLMVNGTNLNGGSSFHYAILSSTDLSLPVSQWTSLATNGFNADGTFSFTNPINASQPSTFYTVKAVP